MATFWDTGVLEYFTPVLVFILIFVVIFAILQKSKILGGYQKADFVISLMVALLALVSESTVKFVAVVSTWYVLLIVAFILIMLALYTSGATPGDGIFELDVPYQIVFYLALTILVVAISNVFGPVFTPYSAGADPGWWALRTIFHPNVLGVLLIMLIAVVLIGKVVKETK
ncbi:hypothetical protein K8R33_03785 [archaeon]|nr:hypothetical protein [archaeon]